MTRRFWLISVAVLIALMTIVVGLFLAFVARPYLRDDGYVHDGDAIVYRLLWSDRHLIVHEGWFFMFSDPPEMVYVPNVPQKKWGILWERPDAGLGVPVTDRAKLNGGTFQVTADGFVFSLEGVFGPLEFKRR